VLPAKYYPDGDIVMARPKIVSSFTWQIKVLLEELLR
jgi:hypothetical protein